MPKPRSRRPQSPAAPRPDRAAMARAVEDFLRAAGLPLKDPNLQDTPARVAEAWATEFLDGYGRTAQEAL
ncbi:MAG TPA: GTP cyclohydrolase I, partial [Aggregicoccus sp.]|nr:GTP cyclohydrolase I [Aggregicoccus sp.]